MYKTVPEVAKILFTYGISYSKPFLNYAIERGKGAREYRSWKYYFSSLKYEHNGDYKKSLEEVEKGLRRCRSKTLYYLSLAQKLSILSHLKKTEGKGLYERLRTDLPKIPILVRNIVVPILLNYCSLTLYDTYKCLGKFRSELYQMDKLTATFISLSKARYDVKQGNIALGISNYIKGLKIAKAIPHPSGILYCLNDIAWYIRERHPLISLKFAEQAAYWAGYYYEGAMIFYVLDTLSVVQKMSHSPELQKTARLIFSLFQELPSGEGYGTYRHYESAIKELKTLVIDPNVSSYIVTEELRSWLGKNIKSIKSSSRLVGITRDNLSNLLNGKTKTVYGKTLRKLIIGLDLKVDILTSPKPVVSEWLKIGIDRDFKYSIETLRDYSPEKRSVLLISTYASELGRDDALKSLARKRKLREVMKLCVNDLNGFADVMKRRWETKEFVIDMTKAHPYVEGRKALVLSFLGRLPVKRRKRFVEMYCDVSEDIRLVMDRFIRNYVRYDRKWGVMVKIPYEELEVYTKRLRLKRTPIALAWYAIEKSSEKKKVLDFLHKVIFPSNTASTTRG